MNSAILLTVFSLLHLVGVSSASLAKELEASLDKALQCRHREPPNRPVLALTPHRFAQLLAVMRNNSGTPACVQPRINAPFAAEDPKTWKFCLFGTCKWDRCNCLPTYTGPNCSLFTKKCWLLYCFLSSCHPLVQTIYCVCDSRYYGVEVTSGDYWYDDGKRNAYLPPPSNWQDDTEFPQVEQFGQTILNIPESNDPILGELGIPGYGDSEQHKKTTPKKDGTGPELSGGIWAGKPIPGHAKYDDGAASQPNRGRQRGKYKSSGVEYADEKPSDSASGSRNGGKGHRFQASGVEYADEKPSDSKSSAQNGRKSQESKVEYADEKQNQEDTSEDLKEVLTEMAKTSSSVMLPYPWAIFLSIVLNLYIVVPYP